MGNVMSKKTVLTSLGIIAAISAGLSLLYLWQKSQKGEDLELQMEKEIANFGAVELTPDGTLDFETFLRVFKLIRKYYNVCVKSRLATNLQERQKYLRAHSYHPYVQLTLDAYETERDSELYIKNGVCERLHIPREAYENALVQYSLEPQYQQSIEAEKEAAWQAAGKLVLHQATELKQERQHLLNTVDIQFYVPEELEEECYKVLGKDWEKRIKIIIVDDLLYAKYKLTAQEIALTLDKYSLALS